MKIYIGIPVHRGVIEDVTATLLRKEANADLRAFNQNVFGTPRPNQNEIDSKAGQGTEYLTFIKEICVDSKNP